MTSGDKPKSRSRLLSESDRELWRRVTRSLAPLKRRAVPIDPPELERVRGERAGVVEKASKPGGAPHAVVRPRPQPAAPIDRRTRRRLKRGTDRIDARIDLHGMTQVEARMALVAFLRGAQKRGAKFVLVITGKGGPHASGERGVLRRQVPFWLDLPELRSLVIGYEPAHAVHGGEGALYVRLRRAANPLTARDAE